MLGRVPLRSIAAIQRDRFASIYADARPAQRMLELRHSVSTDHHSIHNPLHLDSHHRVSVWSAGNSSDLSSSSRKALRLLLHERHHLATGKGDDQKCTCDQCQLESILAAYPLLSQLCRELFREPPKGAPDQVSMGSTRPNYIGGKKGPKQGPKSTMKEVKESVELGRHARVFLKELEAARPSAIIDIIHSGEAFEVREEVKASQKSQRLERGMAKSGITDRGRKELEAQGPAPDNLRTIPLFKLPSGNPSVEIEAS
ncbi:hypothetical protein H0H93_002460 [Arthromyces matolae]|nr:hypothetical protein H0H93_002460 [Arthromyces matolae]